MKWYDWKKEILNFKKSISMSMRSWAFIWKIDFTFIWNLKNTHANIESELQYHFFINVEMKLLNKVHMQIADSISAMKKTLSDKNSKLKYSQNSSGFKLSFQKWSAKTLWFPWRQKF